MYAFLIRPNVRSTLAIVLAAATYFLVPPQVTRESRLLLAWNSGAILLLGVLAVMMCRSDGAQTFERSHAEPSHARSLVVAIVTAVIGLVGTASMLNNTKQMTAIQTHLHLILSACTVITAWLVVHTYFALHYARLYYDETSPGEKSFAGGLEFPERELPDYWDFMYFSLTIAMCYQTSDVTSTTPVMRRLSLLHAVVSFFFVTVVIGLIVGIVQSLL